MKELRIVLTGGGTGGHYYPLIAIGEELREIEKETGQKMNIVCVGDKNFDPETLKNLNIPFIKRKSGKIRIYASIKNITDLFTFIFSIPSEIIRMLFTYPDVVFSKGGHASIPTLISARLLKIPIIIHESDSFPGRTSLWSSLFATRIAVSYPRAQEIFEKQLASKKKDTNIVQLTGQPMRKSLFLQGDTTYFNYNPNIPRIVVVGGSLGALNLNNIVISSLADILQKYQLIHQTGHEHFHLMEVTARALIENNPFANNYTIVPFFKPEELSDALSHASLVITRAGSMLFEIAGRGIPSIVIPIQESNGDHQRENAYALARAGGGVVIEEPNLTSNILVSTIKTLLGDPAHLETMALSARKFSNPHASRTIANEIVSIGNSH